VPAFFTYCGVLDRFGGAAYIAAYDDAFCTTSAPPPPYRHGTGALWRVN
jgi:hypothetical protein